MTTFKKPVIALGLMMVMAAGLAGCEKPAVNETTGVAENNQVVNEGLTDDITVSAAVKEALQLEPKLQAFNFHVETLKGDVTLMGEVDTQEQRILAEQITLATAGAHSVQNKITTKQ